ncbi:dimethylargininase [Kitasatospora sp. NPDC049285]|uniref:dimethylargininase n=1 Tax=Kitasatospora sp. NPDC049285 TaxID=3157096 RepID=UPI003417EAB2
MTSTAVPRREAVRRRYLLCPPTYFAVDYAINPWMDPSRPVDSEAALRQWRKLRDTLNELGHRVETIAARPRLPDMVFAANGASVVDGRVLIARFRHPERAPEATAHRAWFRTAGYRPTVARLPNEGQGDFLPIGGRVLAGSGLRTSPAAHGEAELAFGRRVVSLALTDPRYYHLDTALAVLSDDQIMYYPPAFTPESNRTLHALFPGAILAGDQDASVLGLNAVSDGRHVLLTEAAHGLAAQLYDHGFVPIGVRLPELLKAGGGPKCCVLELHPAPGGAAVTPTPATGHAPHAAVSAAPALPRPRGPLSAGLVTALRAFPDPAARIARPPIEDPWGEDLQLALYVCYELHYQGFAEVDPDWEWHPGLLTLRAALEHAFLTAVRQGTGEPPPLARALAALLADDSAGTGPSHHLLHHGERWQAREYLVHRSLYHLKEADPQMWVVPRLPNPAKAALVSVQYDEYGAGHPDRAHARLFAEMMADLDLDPGYGRYLEDVPAPALAVVNLMSLFGLHRSLRGALVGQFAAVEITSPPGAARLAAALERLGASSAGTLFYREHVLADAVHEQLVRRTVITPLVGGDPSLGPDIAFGIAATAAVEARLGAHLLTCRQHGHSSLRAPLPDASAPAEEA